MTGGCERKNRPGRLMCRLSALKWWLLPPLVLLAALLLFLLWSSDPMVPYVYPR